MFNVLINPLSVTEMDGTATHSMVCQTPWYILLIYTFIIIPAAMTALIFITN